MISDKVLFVKCQKKKKSRIGTEAFIVHLQYHKHNILKSFITCFRNFESDKKNMLVQEKFNCKSVNQNSVGL